MYKRIDLIDELRGIAIILMIIYHFLYQGVLWGSFDNRLVDNNMAEGVRLGAEYLFISLAGISSSFSKDNYKRGLICIYCGIFITIITYYLIPKELISFGILHFLGISIILYELLKNKIISINPTIGIVVSLIFFIITYLIFYKEMFLNQFIKIPLINHMKNNGYLNFIGLMSSSFVSSDYFPIVPWIFLFFSGVYIGKEIKSKNTIKEKISNGSFSILKFLGRHSLLIYMAHIPIIIGILLLYKYI